MVSTVVFNYTIYAFGGSTGIGATKKVFKEGYQYNPTTDQWILITTSTNLHYL